MTDMEDAQRRSDLSMSGRQVGWGRSYFPPPTFPMRRQMFAKVRGSEVGSRHRTPKEEYRSKNKVTEEVLEYKFKAIS